MVDNPQALNRLHAAGEAAAGLRRRGPLPGPHANGMPEMHSLTPLLGMLQNQGRRVALVTDGRLSGASGKIPAAIHVTPEAARGGPLAKLRDGDAIRIDGEAGTLEACWSPPRNGKRARRRSTPRRRRAAWACNLFALNRALVTPADRGALSISCGPPECDPHDAPEYDAEYLLGDDRAALAAAHDAKCFPFVLMTRTLALFKPNPERIRFSMNGPETHPAPRCCRRAVRADRGQRPAGLLAPCARALADGGLTAIERRCAHRSRSMRSPRSGTIFRELAIGAGTVLEPAQVAAVEAAAANSWFRRACRPALLDTLAASPLPAVPAPATPSEGWRCMRAGSTWRSGSRPRCRRCRDAEGDPGPLPADEAVRERRHRRQQRGGLFPRCRTCCCVGGSWMVPKGLVAAARGDKVAAAAEGSGKGLSGRRGLKLPYNPENGM